MGWRREEQETRVSLSEADTGVDADDFTKVGVETPPKIPRPRVGCTKLLFQGIPWNQAWPPEVAHPVGEPDVGIDGQWRSLQELYDSEIDRNGGAVYLLKELPAEDEGRTPGWLSPLEASLEELKSGVAGRDQAVTALLRSEVLGVLPAESGGKEPLKLVVQSLGSASWSADRSESQHPSEVVRGPAEVDLSTLGTDSLGRQVGEDQSGIDAVREADRPAGFKPQRVPTVQSFESMGGRSAVRKSRENEHSRHETERARLMYISGIDAAESIGRALLRLQDLHHRAHPDPGPRTNSAPFFDFGLKNPIVEIGLSD